MKVKLLVSPDFIPRSIFMMPPMGIASLAGSLRDQGVMVTIDDLDVKARRRKVNLSVFLRSDEIEAALLRDTFFPELNKTARMLLSLTDDARYDIIGFSVPEPSNLITALPLASLLKKTGATIVFGGRVGVSEKLLKYPFIDYIMLGDSERSFPALVKAIERGDGLEKVPGLCYRDGTVIRNQMSSCKLTDVPCPDFSGLPLDLYRIKAFDIVDPFYPTYDIPLPITDDERVLVLPYLMSKGCPFNCSFCAVSAHENRPLYKREPKQIRKDLISLKERFNTPYFYMLDSTLNADPAWLGAVCDELRGAGVYWSDSATPGRFPAGLLKKMRDAGCIRITWGVESLSSDILKKMRKGFTPTDAIRTLKEAHEAGIWNYTNWISGFPHEKPQHLKETLEMIEENAEVIDDYTVTGFLFQDSDIMNHPERYGIAPRAAHSYQSNAKDRMEVSSFDEIGGLSWEEKTRQIEDSREQMVNALKRAAGFLLPMHSLFYLYSKFEDKQAIKEWVRSLL